MHSMIEEMKMLTVGDKFPGFKLKGVISNDIQTAFKEFSDKDQTGKWKVVFFWPKDFTFVCPTEIAAFGKLNREFKDRDAVVYGVSVDSEFVHLAWRQQKEELNDLPFPMLADVKRELSDALGIAYPLYNILLRCLSSNSPEHAGVQFAQQLIADLGVRIEFLSGFLERDLQRRIVDVFHHRFGLEQLDFADFRVELRLDLSLMTERFFCSRDHGVLQSANENCLVDAFFFADLFDDSIEILLHITHSSRARNSTFRSWRKESDG
jgi:lipoyl-dependent peroxiredoxin subunit C